MTTTAEQLANLESDDAMRAAQELCDESKTEQDWEAGSTTFEFRDGSKLRVSGTQCEVIHEFVVKHCGTGSCNSTERRSFGDDEPAARVEFNSMTSDDPEGKSSILYRDGVEIDRRSWDDIEARLLGETSAGATVVQIYDNGELVWSHSYFAHGASEQLYNDVCRDDIWNDMSNAANYREFEGCDRDENGNIIDYNDGPTVLTAWKWTLRDGFEFCALVGEGGDDFGALNRHRLPSDEVGKFRAALDRSGAADW